MMKIPNDHRPGLPKSINHEALRLALYWARYSIPNEIAATAKEAVKLIRYLYRDAKSHHHYMEQACNRPLTPKEEAWIPKLEERITFCAEALGLGVVFSGDPRGSTVKLVTPGVSNGWEIDRWNL